MPHVKREQNRLRGKVILTAILLLAGSFALTGVTRAAGLSVGNSGLILDSGANLFYGLYSASSNSAANAFLIQKGASNIFKIDRDGNVTISGTLSAQGSTGIVNASNISSGEFGTNSGGGNYVFGNSVTGNVGIGSANPQYKLDVGVNSTNWTNWNYWTPAIGAVALTGPAVQKLNARATAYAFIAGRNPGLQFSLYMIPWDGTGTLEANCNGQINTGWHPQVAVKGNYFSQAFDSTDFTQYSSIIGDQGTFDSYKANGTQWWIGCTTMASFSQTAHTGTGNANYVTKWTATSTLSNSIIYDNGTNVGIGTTNPGAKLDVFGNIGSVGQNLLPAIVQTSAWSPMSNGVTFAVTNETFESKSVKAFTFTNLVVGDWNFQRYFVNQNIFPPKAELSFTVYVKNDATGVWSCGLSEGDNWGGAPTQVVYCSSTGITTDDGNWTLYRAIMKPSSWTAINVFMGKDYNSVGTVKFAYPSLTVDQGVKGFASGGFQTDQSTGAIYTINGNIGIGTTAPSQKLDVYSIIALQGKLAFDGGDTWLRLNNSNAFSAGIYAGSGVLRTDGEFQVGSNGSTFVVKGSGNVGIGQTNPAAKLDVVGSINSTGTVNGTGLCISGDCRASWAAAGSYWAAGTGGIYYNGGNVGIGTTAPGAMLHVGSNILNTSADVSKVGTFATAVTGDAYPLTVINSATQANNNKSIITFNFGNNSWSSTAFIGGVIENTSGALTGLSLGTYNGSLTEKVRISAAGNVGIGTTNPVSKLSVIGTDGGITQAITLGTYASNYWQISALAYNAAKGKYDLKIGDNSFGAGDILLNPTNGNVGIGTTGPVSKLQVAGDAINLGTTYFNSQLIVSGATNPLKRLVLGYDTTDNYGMIGAYTNGGSVNNLALNPAGGNVGIGQTSPGTKLDVVGSISASGTVNGTGLCISGDCRASWAAAGSYWVGNGNHIYNSNTANVGIGVTNPGAKLDVRGDIYLGAGSSEKLRAGSGLSYIELYNTSTGDMTFYSTYASAGFNFNTANNATPKVRIDSTGNVGIGLTNPAYNLDVSTSINVNSTVGSYRMHGQRVLYADGALTYMGSIDEGVPLILRAGGSDAVRILTNGNFGIGTTNATAKLDVNGTAKFGGVAFNDSTKNDNQIYFSPQSYIEAGVLPPMFNVNNPGVISFVTLNNTTAPFGKVMLFSGYTEGQISDFIPVAVGETLYSEVWAKTGAGTPGSLYIGVSQYDKDKNLINGNAGLTYFTSASLPANTDWTKISGVMTLPTSHTPYNGSDGGPVRYVKYYLIVDYGGGTTPTYIGGILLRRESVVRDSGWANFPGNLGIGKTNPGAALDVVGSGTFTGTVNGTGLCISGDCKTSWAAIGAASSGWTQNGSDVYKTNTSGNVGIGATNPSVALDVNGNVRIRTASDSNGNLRFDAPNPYIYASSYFIAPGGAYFNSGVVYFSNQMQARGGIHNDSGAYLELAGGTGGQTYVSGNLGIGRTSPEYPLEILGTAQTTDFAGLTIAGNRSYSSGQFGTVSMNFALPEYGLSSARIMGIVRSGHTSSTDSSNGFLSFYTRQAGTPAEVMRINGGSVGIATTNPGYKLDVNGSGKFATNAAIIIGDDSSYGSPYASVSWGGASNGYNRIFAANGTSDGMYFAAATGQGFMFRPNGGTSNLVVINSSGNVGIGQTNPATKLDVTGSINSTGTVNGTGLCISGDCRASWAAVAASNGWTINGNDLYKTITGGNVGIGTTGPNAKLEIQTTSSGTVANSLFLGNSGSGTWAGDGTKLTFGASSAIGTDNYTSRIIGYTNYAVNYGSRLYLQTHSATSNVWNTGMMLDESGNVGIGTTAPSQKLDVYSIIALQGKLAFDGGDTWLRLNNSNAFSAGIYAGSGVLRTDGEFQVGSNGSTFVVKGSGNVGVGTTAPVAKLHVISDVASQGPLTNFVVESSVGNANFAIKSLGTANYAYQTFYQGSTGKMEMGITPTNADFYINPNVQVGATGAALYIQKASGNVGIGTTAPGYKLQINGSSSQGDILDLYGDPTKGAQIYYNRGSSYQWREGVGGDGLTPTSYFGIEDAAVGAARLVIAHTTGNVGIGQTNPAAKLDVTGSINSTGTVNGTGLCIAGDCRASWAAAGSYWAAGTGGIYYNGGNVGIGTTNPTSPLTVTAATTHAVPTMVITQNPSNPTCSGCTNQALQINALDAGGSGKTNIGLQVNVGNAATNYAALFMGGNVGIGTTAPGAKLHVVAGVSQYAGTFQSDQSATNWVSTYGAFNLVNANATANNHAIFTFADNAGASSAGVGVKFTDRTNHYGDLYFYTNGTDGYNQRLYIQSTGNVGIGTTNPGAKLEINGTMKRQNKTSGTKTIQISSSWTTVLTITMPGSHTSATLNITYGGYDWISHSAIGYRGQYVIRDGAGSYGDPGSIIYEYNDMGSNNDYIQAQLVNAGSHVFYLQLKTNDGGDGFAGGVSNPNFPLEYDLDGYYSSIN